MWIEQDRYKKMGELLEEARKDAGLMQSDLAALLDKPQSFVSNYENGQRRLDLLEFLRVTTAIGTNPISLFGKIVKAQSTSKAKGKK